MLSGYTKDTIMLEQTRLLPPVKIRPLQVSLNFSCSFCFIINFLVPPKITTLPNRRSDVNAGQNVTLTCNASGDPLPNITWTREGYTESQFKASGYKLYLVNAQRRDVGGYKCTAVNGYGTATSLSVLNINCKLHSMKRKLFA